MIQEVYRCIVCYREFDNERELAEHQCGRDREEPSWIFKEDGMELRGGVITLTKQTIPPSGDQQAGALRETESIIAKWDRDGGLTYRALAIRIARCFGVEVVDQSLGAEVAGL